MALDQDSTDVTRRRIVTIGPPTDAPGGVATYLRTVASAGRHCYTHIEIWPQGRSQRTSWGWSGAWFHLRLVGQVALAARRADIAHVMVTSAPAALARELVLSLASRVFGTPVVSHFHGGNFAHHCQRSKAYRSLLRAVLRISSATIVLSNQMAEDVAAIEPAGQTLKIIPNPVPDEYFDLPLVRPPHGVPPIILCLGEIGDRKGQRALIDAVDSLAGVCELRLAGPVEGRTESEMLQRMRSSAYTTYLGVLTGDDILVTYSEADVYCLYSSAEALPISVLEAMAAGLPVIATDVGSVSDVVGDATGRLLEVGAFTALQDAIRLLSTDSTLRRRLGNNARDLAATSFSMAKHLELLDELYDAVTLLSSNAATT